MILLVICIDEQHGCDLQAHGRMKRPHTEWEKTVLDDITKIVTEACPPGQVHHKTTIIEYDKPK